MIKKETSMEKKIVTNKNYLLTILILFFTILLSSKVWASDAGTREDAVKWVYSQEGKSLDYDGAYGAQCVDLIKYYYAYFGQASYARGNGCDYVSNALPNGWTRIKNTAEFVPEPGDIAVWGTELSQYGHVAIILSADAHSFVSMDQNWPSGSACKQVTHTYNKFWGVIRPNFVEISEPSGNSPIGYLDSVFADMGKITIRGWAADMDVPNEPIDVHVYAIQDGVRNGIGVLKADNYRPDVHMQNTGINEYHGFEATINTELTGNVEIEVYGINVGSGVNSMLEDSPQTVVVPRDTIQPTISNVEVKDLSASGYTVTCNIEDNVEISRVRFATWTEENEQDDIVWKDETLSGSTISYKVDISEHNNENNCIYFTHIYAYDLAGNSTGYPVTVYVDAEPPVISDVEVSEVSASGYTIKCKIEDNEEISRVRFATWTEENEQDDIVWKDETLSGNTVSCRINVADHNNERNCKYWTHIYAYDLSDNGAGYPVSVYIDGKAPVISNVEITDISQKGYTVKCSVEDDYSGVNRVQFPTWYDNDNPYGNDNSWNVSSSCSGKLEDGKYVYHVRVSDYDNQLGVYNTHIYAWDEHENRSECYPLEITVNKDHEHNYVSTIKKKATCTESGIMLYTCKDDDDSYEKEIPATGHQNTEVRNVKEATCAEEGYTGDTYCKDCGTKLSTGEKIAKKEHTWDSGKVTQEASCIKTGIRTYTCTTCQSTKTEEIPATGKHENTEVRNVKEATCAEEGYTGDTYCKDCGTKLSTGEKIAKKAHIWDSGRVTQEATCTKTGTKTYICTTCQSTRTEEIPATGHVNKITKFAKKATCKSEGYTGDIYCKDCGELLEEGDILPKEEHVWDEGRITQQPGCTKSGERMYTCTTCQITKTEEIPATGHLNKVTKFAKKATCKTEGYTGDIYCQDCGELLEEGNALPQEAHIWDEGKITKQPTSSAAGVRTYTCKNCGTTKTESIAKLQPKKLTPGKVIKDKATNGVYKVLKDGVTVEFAKTVSRKTSVKIPDTVKLSGITCKVTEISANAFKNDTTLRTVTIGKNVTIIGSNAFYGARKLSKVSGGSAISKIGDKAFYNCSGLTGIELSKTVKYIGRQAFYNCKNFKTIIVKTSQLTSKNVGTKAFTGIYTKPIVKVPANKFKAYQKLLKSKGMSTKAIYKK